MKISRITLIILMLITVVINSCSDDNSPGGSSNNNNNGGGSNSGGCAGGPSTVTDIDGNVYNVVSIGNQCWMKENLKTTHYKNGVAIPTGLSDAQWQATTNGACADYDNNPTNTAVYGKLYNWYAVADPNGLCPTGWHEPEGWEWNQLIKYIDPNADTNCIDCVQSSAAGGRLKETGLNHWSSPNLGATNDYNFSGLPGGCRFSSNASYEYMGNYGYWWTATSDINLAYYHVLVDVSTDEYKGTCIKTEGFSVRCVRD